MKTQLCLLLLAPVVVVGGEFINLTFDNPDLTGSLTPEFPGGPLDGGTAKLLPGWSLRADGQPVTVMAYSPLGTLGYGIGAATLYENTPANAALAGRFSLVLQSGQAPTGPELRLSQTGTIPADAAGLWIFGGGYAQMFINGERVGDTVNDLTVDVSRFAGQEVNLEFLVRAGDSLRFDILGFTAVPEPETWALLGLGLGAVLCLGRRR